MDQVGEKLKELRKKKKLTLREVGKAMNVDFAHISRLESGKKVPTLELLNAFAEFYDVPMSYFFDNEGMEIPNELDQQNVRWMKFIGEMEERNLTPEEVKNIVDELERIKKLF